MLEATWFSWASKRGLPRDVRAILGYHTSKFAGVGTELIYEADAQAHPLSRMSAMLDEITRGTFVPDAPRGQQLKHADGASREQADPHSDDDMESSSESAGDEEEPEHSDDKAAAGRTLGDWNGRVDMAKLETRSLA